MLALSLLTEEELYGYQTLGSDLCHEDGMLYLILRGLEKDGAAEAYLQKSPTGENAQVLPSDKKV